MAHVRAFGKFGVPGAPGGWPVTVKGSGLPVVLDDGAALTGRERRLSERVLVDLEVDYKHDDTFLFAYITDISVMGIFVRTTTPEPPGTRLNLRFQPKSAGWPQGETFELEGQVIWVNPFRGDSVDNRNPGMGIQFVDLTEEQRERIKQLVRTFAYLSEPDEDDRPARD